MNIKNAVRGARNPLNSWNKSDSVGDKIGTNDLKLLCKLVKAGSDERKFMRQILVSIDITAPIYWWKEFDTYKVGTVANSTSTMHKLADTPITVDMFSVDYKDDVTFKSFLEYLELLRITYNISKEKKFWRMLIQYLPESFNQMRTVTLNYEVLLNMYNARKNHKLVEWKNFCEWIITLPYMKDFIEA